MKRFLISLAALLAPVFLPAQVYSDSSTALEKYMEPASPEPARRRRRLHRPLAATGPNLQA